MKPKHFFKQYGMTIVATVVIFFLCFAPPPTFEKAPTFSYSNADKIIHFLMFSVLGFVFYHNFQQNQNRFSKTTALLICLAYPALIGLFTELVQDIFIPLRSGDFIDWLFDLLGTLAGFSLAQIIFSKKSI